MNPRCRCSLVGGAKLTVRPKTAPIALDTGIIWIALSFFTPPFTPSPALLNPSFLNHLKMSTISSRPLNPTPSPSEDHFDRLPNSLLLLIFNRVKDIKALGHCCSVSKRFNSLARQTDTVLVKVDCIISNKSDTDTDTDTDTMPKGIFGNLLEKLLTSVFKLFQALHQILLPKKRISAQISHHSAVDMLRNFHEIRTLHIELPAGELDVDRGALLKWTAEFGRSLDSCIILFATNYAAGTINSDPDHVPILPIEDPLYPSSDLKMKVIWITTPLIAASARHCLLREIVSEHPTLEELLLTDTDGQGMLRMGKEQLAEFRHAPVTASATSVHRTQIPALKMKLWYAERLELPESGHVMNGATLVAIRPVDQPMRTENDLITDSLFDEPFSKVIKAMVKRKSYLLGMNPF